MQKEQLPVIETDFDHEKFNENAGKNQVVLFDNQLVSKNRF